MDSKWNSKSINCFLPYIMMRLEQAIIVENSINETLKLPLEHCDECGEWVLERKLVTLMRRVLGWATAVPDMRHAWYAMQFNPNMCIFISIKDDTSPPPCQSHNRHELPAVWQCRQLQVNRMNANESNITTAATGTTYNILHANQNQNQNQNRI